MHPGENAKLDFGFLSRATKDESRHPIAAVGSLPKAYGFRAPGIGSGHLSEER